MLATVEHLPRQRFRIRSGFGIVVRILGLAFVGLGVWIGVIPFLSNLANWMLGQISTNALIECLPGTLIGMSIGIPMLGIGWAMAFLRHSVEIDLVENCVTELNDFLIWKKRKTCPLSHVRSVVLNSTATRGKDTTSYYVNVLIETNDDHLKVVSEPASGELHVRNVANQLAEILKVEVNDQISSD